jgi:hypothetical protein
MLMLSASMATHSRVFIWVDNNAIGAVHLLGEEVKQKDCTPAADVTLFPFCSTVFLS